MNETVKSIIIFSAMGVMSILFWIVLAMVVRYLISVFRLNRQVRTAESDLWVSLGSPTMFPVGNLSFNPFKELFAQMRFCKWFLKGGEGAQSPETKAMVEKTRRLFRIGMIGFVGLFIMFGVIGLMIVMTRNG